MIELLGWIPYLLVSSQLSTQEVWKRWRQASLRTMFPARKSDRQITQWGLASFTPPPSPVGLTVTMVRW